MKKNGFTLAEMMVVMLILSIIMAAFAPIMTRRNKADMNNRSPWQYVDGESNHNIYFNASGDDTVAMLGTATKIAKLRQPLGKFIINAGDRAPFAIRFQYGGDGDTNNAGALRMTTDTVSLGPTYTTTQTPGTGVTAVGQGISLLGNNNTSVGYQALKNNTTGAGNVANGYQALNGNTIGLANVANGYQALATNTEGAYNIANGYQALYSNTTGSYNIANGYQALYSSTTGKLNVAEGYQTLYNNVSGIGNVAIGYQILANVTGTDYSSGNYNTVLGYQSMIHNNGGDDNVVLGYQSLPNNKTGNTNISVGKQALFFNGYGSHNIAMGYRSMYNNTGDDDDNGTGWYNVALGDQALYSNTTGSYNSGYGYHSLWLNSAGSANTAIGYNACSAVSGSNKTCIGAGSGPNSGEAEASDASDVVYIGNANSTVYIKGGLVVGGNVILNADQGKVVGMREANGHMYRFANVHGDNSAYFNWIYNETTFPYSEFSKFNSTYKSSSDRRLKNISGANNDGLDKLMQLNVFNFTFKQDKKKMPHVGVIAQDLQKVFPNAVMKDKKGYLMIRWDEMFYCMLNSIKELAAKVTNIDSRVT
ncbi:MAG: tail fiber domain-containing protein, partial [Clostridiaceae bacterium]|nr:tail fiber domain-containing protein [Clostridiaceae bacterium]